MLIIVAVCVGCYLIVTPIKQRIHLGLDLQGGLRALVELEPNESVKKITPDIQDEELQILQRRLGGLGVNELTFEKVGGNRILIEMPGLNDPEQALQLIRQAAVLEMRPLTTEQNNRAYADQTYAKADADRKGHSRAWLDSKAPIVTGEDLANASPGTNNTGQFIVNFQLKGDAAKRFYAFTSSNIGKPLPIFLDGKFISGPTIQGAISDRGEITGNFTQTEAVNLANELNSGALKVPTKVIDLENVGPTLGRLDLEKSLIASLVGLAVVLVFMVVFYRVPGFLADIALVVYCGAILGYIGLFGVVLSLPGIAGIVLSIGMAVDANVLIFERIKEELWAGRTTRAAVGVGFKRAFVTVFDSHVTTIVGAAVLYWLGTGTVKGFALTLLWGTVFSLFTAVYVTRAFVDMSVDNDLATSPALYGA